MVNIIIPDDLQKIIADIVANKSREEENELDEDIYDRLYIEILPEEYDYYPEDKVEKKENPIVIEL